MGRALTVSQKRARVEAIWAEAKFRKYGEGVEGFKAFCEDLYYVRSKNSTAGRCLFALYPFQRELADTYFSNKYNVVLKSRQLGATTMAMALALWRCIYQPGGATVLCLSKTQVDARANLDQVAHALSFLPQWYRDLMPVIEAQSNDRLVMRSRDGSTSLIECLVATERSGASRTASLVIADEAALYQKPEDTFRSLAPATDAAAMSPGNEAVMLVFSTARGGSNYFAQLYRDAAAGRNRYKATFIPWTENPLSNPKALEGEVDWTVVNARRAEFVHEPHKFYSEYPSTPEEAFMSSGHTRFANLPSSIDFEEFQFRGALVSTGTHAEWVDTDSGNLWINFDPREKDQHPANYKQLFIGADPAMGVGGDSSVAYVVGYDGLGSIDIVGYYHSNHIEAVDFADVLWDLGWYFGSPTRPAMIACEMQPSGGGGGQTVVGRLRDRGYNSLYRYIQPAAKGRKALSYYGMPTTRSTKPLLINTLAEWLAQDELLGEGVEAMRLRNVPPILRDELGTFVVMPNGTTAADTGCHDDHVIAAAIAVYVAATTVRAPTPKRNVQEGDSPLDANVLTLDLSEMRKQIDRNMAKVKRRQAQDIRRTRRTLRRR